MATEESGEAKTATSLKIHATGTFAGCALYHGDTTVVKKLRKHQNEIQLKRAELVHLKTVMYS